MEAQPIALPPVDGAVSAKTSDGQGEPPSVATPTTSEQEVVGNKIADLQFLRDENASLKQTIADLTRKLESIGHPVAIDGYFTMHQFLAALTIRLGRSYRWRLSYLEASHTSDCTVVSNGMVQRWQATDKVPEWAVQQIDRMKFPTLKGNHGKPWNDEERKYLVDLYNTDPTTMNCVLADSCTKKFRRMISEGAIKGELDRQIRNGTIASRASLRAPAEPPEFIRKP